jgi:hypothetical protein
MGDEAGMNWGISAPEGRGAAFGGAAKDAVRRLLLATVAMAALGAGASRGETAGGALVKAYLNNPDINTSARRFALRMKGCPRRMPAISRQSTPRAITRSRA